MRKGRIGASVLALVVAGAVAATPAMGASAASLQKQINQLKKRVTQLEGEIDNIYACQTVIPIAQFGDPTGAGAGYVYEWPDHSYIRTTGLDYTDPSAGGSWDWIISVDDSCVERRASAGTAHAWKPAAGIASAGKLAALRRSFR